MMPVRLVWYLFGVLGVVAVANALVDSSGPYAHVLELLFYACIAVCGIAYVFVELHEGYCLSRPISTREDSPVYFWLDVAFASFLAMMGVGLLWAAL